MLSYNFLLYIFLLQFPVLAALFILLNRYRGLPAGAFGVINSIVSILILVPLVFLTEGSISSSVSFFPSFNINWDFLLDRRNGLFLLEQHLCFLFVYLLSTKMPKMNKLSHVLILVCMQSFLNVYILCTNTLLVSVVHIVLAVFLFFLLKMATEEEAPQENDVMRSAEAMVFLQIVAGVGLSVWAIFLSDKTGGFSFEIAPLPSTVSIGLSLAVSIIFLFALPVYPWSGWYLNIVQRSDASSLIFIPATIYVSSILYQLMHYVHFVFHDSIVAFRPLLAGLSFLLAFFAAALTALQRNFGSMLSGVIMVLISIALFELGFSSEKISQSSYLIVLLLPIIALTTRFFEDYDLSSKSGRAITIIIFMILFGLPGTQVFYIFSLAGAQIFDTAEIYGVALVVIWMLYVMMIANCGRCIFFHEEWVKKNKITISGDLSRQMVWQDNYHLISFLLIFYIVGMLIVSNLVTRFA